MSTEHVKWESPLFILGNPRSGTSLLRLMLHRHSKICIPPESHFFLWLENKYGEWDLSMLDEYLKDLYSSTKFETWELEKEELKTYLKMHNLSNYAILNSLIYRFFAVNQQEKSILYWGDKNSLWIEKLNRIKYYYPKAFYVHIVRDGRDVACSYKALYDKKINSPYAPKLPNAVENIANTWQKNVLALDIFLSSLPKSNYITVFYEDLLKYPEKILTSILEKLSLQFESNQLSYYTETQENIEPQEFIAWKEKLLHPPDLNNIGKFERELTVKEIQDFNQIAFTSLKTFGYL